MPGPSVVRRPVVLTIISRMMSSCAGVNWAAGLAAGGRGASPSSDAMVEV